MFEFDAYEKRLHQGSALSPSQPYRPFTDVAAMSFLYWGEHCIECAAPDCYATCDLYQPRPDGGCRRFAYGIHQNRRFGSFRGYGAEVAFKTWGRLKANGNTRMENARVLLWKERLIGLAMPLLKAAGAVLSGVTGEPSWRNRTVDLDHRARRVHRRRSGGRTPDLFLIEVFNPMPHPVSLQVAMRIGDGLYDPSLEPSRLPAPLEATVALACGYSRHQIERHRFAAISESGMPFKVTVTPEGEGPATLIFLALDFVMLRRRNRRQHFENQIKCVVLDLDNTVWRGVLAEHQEVVPNHHFVRLIHELDRRGILLSIASKNDHAQAWRQLEAFGLAEYFLHPQINWLPKSTSIETIAGALNLGLDAFAFIDDSRFEREEVAFRLPLVTCLDAGDVDKLFDDPRFRGSDSVDARNRRRYYQQAIHREQARRADGDDYRRFLRSSRIVLQVADYAQSDFERVFELAQRTNQLNFSGTKYDREALQRILDDDGLEKHVLRSADKFGSYGTIGLALVRRIAEEIRVEEFMLSCRVQGKGLEQALFDYLVEMPGPVRATRLWINFQPMSRNGPAQHVLNALDFEPAASGQGLSLDLSRNRAPCDFIEVVSRAPGGRRLEARRAPAGKW